MTPIIVDVIVGARPNFMKAAALFAAAPDHPALALRLVHTGQHYDPAMSDVFLNELGLPNPACHLGVGSNRHAVQTADIMTGYDAWIQKRRPQVCLVVGDVNSTAACALTAVKEGILTAHVEAGLRSFDRSMPEEINRVLTDSISDLLFVTEPSGLANLIREGRPYERIHLAGNVMIDTLLRMKPRAEALKAYRRFHLTPGGYALVTLHRPANVDQDPPLGPIAEQLLWLAQRLPLVFPVHPRTQKRLDETGWTRRLQADEGVCLTPPLGYLEALSLVGAARMTVTDSGGLQEEAAALGLPCLTLRESTERPATIESGSNTLIGRDWDLFQAKVQEIQTRPPTVSPIPWWDGRAAGRILQRLQSFLRNGG